MSEIDDLRERCDELAAALVLVCHDLHPVYADTTGWRGGIGGQAITQGCSIIDPPPGQEWSQLDLPTEPAREWLREQEAAGRPVDLDGIRQRLIKRWEDMLRPASSAVPVARGAENEGGGNDA